MAQDWDAAFVSTSAKLEISELVNMPLNATPHAFSKLRDMAPDSDWPIASAMERAVPTVVMEEVDIPRLSLTAMVLSWVNTLAYTFRRESTMVWTQVCMLPPLQNMAAAFPTADSTAYLPAVVEPTALDTARSEK